MWTPSPWLWCVAFWVHKWWRVASTNQASSTWPPTTWTSHHTRFHFSLLANLCKLTHRTFLALRWTSKWMCLRSSTFLLSLRDILMVFKQKKSLKGFSEIWFTSASAMVMALLIWGSISCAANTSEQTNSILTTETIQFRLFAFLFDEVKDWHGYLWWIFLI